MPSLYLYTSVYTCTRCYSYQWLQHLLCRHANSVEACPVETTRGAVSPGQAAILCGALGCSILLAPELAANITLCCVGTMVEFLSKNLLALMV